MAYVPGGICLWQVTFYLSEPLFLTCGMDSGHSTYRMARPCQLSDGLASSHQTTGAERWLSPPAWVEPGFTRQQCPLRQLHGLMASPSLTG